MKNVQNNDEKILKRGKNVETFFEKMLKKVTYVAVCNRNMR